ncbi:MAG: hypothetical protein LUE27_03455 [Clostridia bacterium]|nr:hypothetical protein [Clostridia bacterium]
MAIKLEKDKITGETLVYEVTSVTDKSTGKSAEQRVLKGRLHPFTEEEDHEAISGLFAVADGKEPVMLEDLDRAHENATEAIRDVVESVSPDEDVYSWLEVSAMMKEIADAVIVKDNSYRTLKTAYKDLVAYAADEVRRNETLGKENSKLAKSNEKLRKRAEDRQREGLENLLEYKQMMDKIESYKEIISKSEQLEDTMKEVISKQGELINALVKGYNDLKSHLSRYEDVSGWDDVQE